MKLRKRSAVSSDGGMPEVKKKKLSSKQVRRSARNRNSSKDESKSDQNKVDKDSGNKHLLKSKKKKCDDDEPVIDGQLFPAICETGMKELIALEEEAPEDYSLLVEAAPLFECRVCDAFFRNIIDFIKHKQMYCTSQTEKSAENYQDKWNPFLSREFLDIFPEEYDSSSSFSD